jgi:uncharacterized membrane protein YgcG
MKSVTEFASFTLNQGLKHKTEFEAQGKVAEELQTALGEAMKLEGDRLTWFMHALPVAAANADRLKRVVLWRLNEGEQAPAKSVMVEELGTDLRFVAEFHPDPNRQPVKHDAKSRGGKGGRGGDKGRGGAGGGGRDGARGPGKPGSKPGDQTAGAAPAPAKPK